MKAPLAINAMGLIEWGFPKTGKLPIATDHQGFKICVRDAARTRMAFRLFPVIQIQSSLPSLMHNLTRNK
jgi:hypothetical protein